MKVNRLFYAALSLLLFSVSTSSASLLSSPEKTISSPTKVVGFADYEATGLSMSGLTVTVSFGSTSSSGVWTSGSGANGESWSLTMATYNGTYGVSTIYNDTLWVLSNLSTGSLITSITIDGLSGGEGNTVFDVNLDNDPSLLSTFGSFTGLPFYEPTGTSSTSYIAEAILADSSINVSAVKYRNPVYLGSNAQKGDLFATLTIDFATGLGFNDGSDKYYFAIDTDIARSAPVPEPTTMVLFGTGIIAGLGSMVRRRKK